MDPVRVLVVDDAVVIRRVLTTIIEEDPDLELAGIAPNGRIALARVAQLKPDIITLDIEMPELDGLETLKELRKTDPRLPVIMFSTLTERGASATLEALANGASDYVTKPHNVGSVTEAMDRVRAELLPKIKALVPRRAPGPAPAPVTPLVPAAGALVRPTARPVVARPVDVVAIGCSTGGPNALNDVIPELPGDLAVPVVITQHMPPVFTRLLAERLDAASPLTVREAFAGAELTPGTVWIAEGDHHLLVRRQGTKVVIDLGDGPPESSCRPAVDPMFRSVVEVYGARTLGVVLTGMGYDGMLGAQAVQAAGGQVVAQDQASSVVWGMPGAVAGAGAADEILPLTEVAGAITRRTLRRAAELRGAS